MCFFVLFFSSPSKSMGASQNQLGVEEGWFPFGFSLGTNQFCALIQARLWAQFPLSPSTSSTCCFFATSGGRKFMPLAAFCETVCSVCVAGVGRSIIMFLLRAPFFGPFKGPKGEHPPLVPLRFRNPTRFRLFRRPRDRLGKRWRSSIAGARSR